MAPPLLCNALPSDMCVLQSASITDSAFDVRSPLFLSHETDESIVGANDNDAAATAAAVANDTVGLDSVVCCFDLDF